MTKKRRSYTDEFRIEAIQLYKRSSKTQEQLKKSWNWSWLYLALEEKNGASADVSDSGEPSAVQHIRELDRENDILRQERDILTLGLTANPRTK